MEQRESGGGLTLEEIDVFARGLYYLASVDNNVDDREVQLISEFLQETGSKLTLDELRERQFSFYEAVQVLDKTFLRKIFVKAAIALVHSDGVYSDEERRALGTIADVFGLSNAEFGELEQEARRQGLQ
ncbi:MAG: TerB family tellurite resistance protein [Myxococcales bacterium]|jgi:tellurite resistance protein|nr:TerB family tellurite resistance protein [Myxococcales bacterium]